MSLSGGGVAGTGIKATVCYYWLSKNEEIGKCKQDCIENDMFYGAGTEYIE